MEHSEKKRVNRQRSRTLLLGLCIVVCGFLVIALYTLAKKHTALTEMYALTQQETSVREQNFHALIAELEDDNRDLKERLDEEKEQNDEFEEQIEDLSGTVGKLDKLSKIDSELLQKYSKVYFLNEHYTPPKLLPIAKKFLSKPDDVPEYIHANVEPFIDDLLEDADDDDINLRVLSGYRSFDEQAQLKNGYVVQYGTGANTFSADQGYSEHQLGTAVDFSTAELGGSLVGFEQTDAYVWLLRNAHRYGFTLSYPENNQYYVYEPWHWRFVGEDLAEDLHDDKKHFYDLDQREINTYLISFFD